jgi:serine/threonine-protein phosphatase PGAM5
MRVANLLILCVSRLFPLARTSKPAMNKKMKCTHRLRILSVLIVAYAAWKVTTATDAPDPVAFQRTVYLVRHGEYATENKTTLEAGPGLTALGIAQARLIAARLRGMPVRFSTLTSSMLSRAKETAAGIHEMLPDVPVTQSSLLNECVPRTWDVRAATQISPIEAVQCQSRLDTAFKTYFAPAKNADENDILVAHGNVIRFFVTKALGVDSRAWLGMSVAHASLTVIRVKPDGSFTVLAVGDVGHIPPNLQSWGAATDPQLVPTPLP